MATKKPKKKTATKKAPVRKKAAPKKLSFDELLAKEVAGSAASTLDTGDDVIWSRPGYHISTRNIVLDKRLGGMGLPGGRLIEDFGPESCGKSTKTDQCIAEVQAQGGLAVLIDSEHVRDPAYMQALGVDLKRLVICQVNHIEQVFDEMTYWAEAGRRIVEDPSKPVLIVWDSVAGTPTQEEFEAKTRSDKFRASAAKVIKQGMRATCQKISKNGTTVLVTNQVYSSMAKAWGNDKVTYGGDGIRYHATIRIDNMVVGRIYPRGATAETKVPPIGQKVSAIVVKNKIASPMQRAVYGIEFGYGVDNAFGIWNEVAGPDVKISREDALEAGMPILQNGSWYSIHPDLGDFPAFQGGHLGLRDLIAAHPELWDKLVAAYKAL